MSKPEGSLVALVFDDPYKADEARAALLRMEGEGLLEIEESAVLVKKGDDKYRVTQDTNIVSNRQQVGHVLGIVAANLTGTMPLILAGTLAGRLFGKFTDTGVTNDFIKQVKGNLSPGTSSLLLFLRTDAERRSLIIERLARYQGRILTSNMPLELEREVDEAMEAAALAQNP